MPKGQKMPESIPRDQMIDLHRNVDVYIKSLSWFDWHGKELLKIGARILLFVLGFWIFSFSGWFAKILGLAVISYAYYGIGITGVHETGHKSFVSSKKPTNF